MTSSSDESVAALDCEDQPDPVYADVASDVTSNSGGEHSLNSNFAANFGQGFDDASIPDGPSSLCDYLPSYVIQLG